MAFVYPFKGFRYNKDAVGDFNRVVTQPYDKTTPSMQDAYYQRSPYNVVRITLNLEKRGDPETGYPDAGVVFRQWIEQKVLAQDSLPTIYAYYQEYAAEGSIRLQKGFIALLDLKNSGSGIIPHETHAGRAQTGPPPAHAQHRGERRSDLHALFRRHADRQQHHG